MAGSAGELAGDRLSDAIPHPTGSQPLFYATIYSLPHHPLACMH